MPLDFSRYEGMEDDRFVLRSITDEIMYEIMELSGQEYVDVYATKAKSDSQKRAREASAAAKLEAKQAKQAKAGADAAIDASADEEATDASIEAGAD
jgi:1-acyl-sn-glycerol-3-phosphate acyltransferase